MSIQDTTIQATTASILDDVENNKAIKLSMPVLVASLILWIVASVLFAFALVHGLVFLFGVTAGCLISMALMGVIYYFTTWNKSGSKKFSEFIIGGMVYLQGVSDGFKDRKAAKAAAHAANLDAVVASFVDQGLAS